MSKDKLKGGKADNLSMKDIAKHHDMDTKNLKGELKKGTEDELEHTDDEATSKEIAKDHLMGNPKYYSDMEKVEIDEADMPIIKRTILSRLREHVNIKIADENPESTIYFICKGNTPIGGIEIDNVTGSLTDDTSNIIDIRISPLERPIKVITDAIPLIFRTMPTMNTLLIPTNPKNRDFWERAGANRIKDGLHAFQRGH